MKQKHDIQVAEVASPNRSKDLFPTPAWVLVGRVVFSSCCALVLAVAIPNLGSVALPNHQIGYGWRDALAVAILVIPLIVIWIGAIYSRVLEFIGWALAVGILVWMVIAYHRIMAA